MGDAPRIGSINNLVVFIRFKNESEFTDSTAYYNRLFNDSTSSANSMINYFREVSYNQLSIRSFFYPISGTVFVVSFQDTAHTRGYFQTYNATTNPIGYQGGNNGTQRTNREHALLRDASNYIASQVPVGLNLDGDNDGRVDNVCFNIYGSPGAWSDLLWPHRWSLYSLTVNINGKRVYDYNFQLQTSLKSSGVGVLCHEMFHSLGSPDLYHYTSNGIAPVYRWDVMENNLNPPQHMGAYMKYRYGTWISSIPIISAPGTYTLNPLTSSTNNCYRINSTGPANEFYVLEYRKRNTLFENGIPGDGLLVYRINNSVSGNASGPPDEVYIYRPGGTLTVNGTPANAFYNSTVGRTAIDNSTDPTPFLSNGVYGGLQINNVTAPDATISFTIPSPSAPPQPATVQNPWNGKPNVYKPYLNLKWISSGGATGFRLSLGTNNPPTNLMNNVDIGNVTSYVPAGLSYNTLYYWQIVPYNSFGSATGCPVWSFTTQSNASYGGGQSGHGYYYFANSTSDAMGAPSQPLYNWSNLATTEITSWTSGTSDDGYFRVPDIGFNFNFFGTTYRTSNVYIGTNGYITFGGGSTAYVNVAIPNTAAPNNFITGAWTDLDVTNSTYPDAHIYYGGDASKFVVTWMHAHKYGSSEYITFQIILNSDSTINIQYNDAQTSTPLTNSITNACTVGMENSGGTAGINYRYAVGDTSITGGAMFSSPVALGMGKNQGSLPVNLSNLNFSVTDRNVLLKWVTTREENNSGFEIQKQYSGTGSQYSDWKTITFIKGKGNSTLQTEYSFEDKKLQTGKYKYRLKQIDYNGNYQYYNLESIVEIGIPQKYNLSQNYPNPFNPVTKIDFDLPADGFASLVVYDMTGKEITKLVNEFRIAGYYTAEFNASVLSSGIYFYRLNVNGYSKVLKMAVLK
jgi:M6 family metalloprotease-like protein